jgi:hypothetical protein
MVYLAKPEIVLLVKDLEGKEMTRLMRAMERRSLVRKDKVFLIETVTGKPVIIRASQVLFMKEVTEAELEEQKKKEAEAQEAAEKGQRIVRPGIPGRRFN